MSKKSLAYRLISRMANSPLWSTVSFAAVLLFIYAGSVMSNLSFITANTKTGEVLLSRQTRTPPGGREVQVATSLNSFPVAVSTTQERNIEEETENADPLIPPLHASVDERMEWFRRKLPQYKLFRSDNLTKKFQSRVLEFLNQKCEVQFFMTWISAARYFGRRGILAVESVFRAHPQGCLTILSRTMDSARGDRILKPLLDRGFKVLAVTPDIPFLLKNTPAKAWFDDMKSGKKDPGKIPLPQNLSNLLRLAVVYKYGGVYLDTDFIVLKSFKGLKNTICAQNIHLESKKWKVLNNAVLVFDMNHPLLFKFIEEFALTFNGNIWGHNGPGMVSRVVRRVEGKPGYNFTILPPGAFYPVNWLKIGYLFKMPKDEAQSRWVEAKLHQLNVQAYGVHLWNKKSRKLRIEEGSVMGRLISEHCVMCNNIYSSWRQMRRQGK